MKHIHDALRNRLLTKAGLFTPPPPRYSLDALARSEWSTEFENHMRCRLIMGALRYGLIGIPNKPQYNRIPSMIKRLKRYEENGNLEYLVDVANLCLLEYVEGTHPNRHFHSQDEHKEHCTVIR